MKNITLLSFIVFLPSILSYGQQITHDMQSNLNYDSTPLIFVKDRPTINLDELPSLLSELMKATSFKQEEELKQKALKEVSLYAAIIHGTFDPFFYPQDQNAHSVIEDIKKLTHDFVNKNSEYIRLSLAKESWKAQEAEKLTPELLALIAIIKEKIEKEL